MTRFARVQRHDSPAAVPRRRRTAQQQAVLDMLGGSDHFRSAQQLHLELNRQRPLRVGLATVYRILQTFTDQRTVETQRAEDGETLYRLRTDNGHHHYLLCRRCGHAVGFTPTTLEQHTSHLARQHGFADVTHHIDLYGICPRCADAPCG